MPSSEIDVETDRQVQQHFESLSNRRCEVRSMDSKGSMKWMLSDAVSREDGATAKLLLLLIYQNGSSAPAKCSFPSDPNFPNTHLASYSAVVLVDLAILRQTSRLRCPHFA